MSPSEDALPIVDWECLWAPYDPPTYQAVLEQIHPDDVVLDIGAGDLRLGRQIAGIVRKVYCVETNPGILNQGLKTDKPLPDNLIALCADARTLEFPSGITIGILLMRHCAHFKQYANKLKEINCQRLVTNARWHMNIENIDLLAPRVKFEEVNIGWYACWCGAVGFKSGPVELLTPETDAIIHEVINCPACLQHQSKSMEL